MNYYILPIVCTILFLGIVIFFCKLNTNFMNKRILETFQEQDELFHISPADKSIYFEIIDTYQLLLNRDPEQYELNKNFNDIKNVRTSIDDVIKSIQESDEYARINDNHDTSHLAPANTSQASEDRKQFNIMLQTNIPQHSFNIEFLDFLYSKYNKLNKDQVSFIKYVKKTPEYIDIFKHESPPKDDERLKVVTPSISLDSDDDVIEEFVDEENISTKSSKDVGEENDTRISISECMELDIKRPNANLSESGVQLLLKEHKKQLDECDTLPISKNKHLLSDKIAKRNIDQLKYHCEISKNYKNVNKDLTLLKDQSWSVPQKYTPVCYSATCDVSDQTSQTSLIGTLLEDSENTKILPSFSFSEDE
jgi:hypothetical protein